MSEIFFTADSHFYHENIIEHCKRPFSSVKEMNETIITNWNKVITKNNIVYHLGDFSWRHSRKYIEYLLSRLNYKELHLIRGNHDDIPKLSWGFTSINELLNLKLKYKNEKVYLTLCHYPMEAWRYQRIGGIHLHGHSHGNKRFPILNRLDVGLDCCNFFPLSMEEVLTAINNINYQVEKFSGYIRTED